MSYDSLSSRTFTEKIIQLNPVIIKTLEYSRTHDQETVITK